MKIKATLLSICATLALVASASFGAVNVAFTGGGGSPLSITLPSISWEIVDADDFNGNTTFGIGIAVGQTPSMQVEGDSTGGNSNDWDASGSVSFPGTSSLSNDFFANNSFGGANNGGIIWLGIRSNEEAVIGDIISYSGGTFGNDTNVPQSFIDGSYEVYLISGQTAGVVSAAAVVPEPSSYGALTGLAALAFVSLRRRRRV